MHILNVELHFDYPSREGEQKKAACIHPNSPSSPPLPFFICYWSKWGQLLEISVEPWMPQWWLSLRLMHLIYLFGILEMLFSSQLGVPGPVKLFHDETHSGCLHTGLLCRAVAQTQKEQGGPCISRPLPLVHKWSLAEKRRTNKNREQVRHQRLVFIISPSIPYCLLVFSSVKKSLPFKTKFSICETKSGCYIVFCKAQFSLFWGVKYQLWHCSGQV